MRIDNDSVTVTVQEPNEPKGVQMTTVPTSPEARAIQALSDAEASLRAMSGVTQGVSNSADEAVARLDVAADALKTATNSIESASDSLKNVSASNDLVISHIDRAANALVRAAAAMEEIREGRIRSTE